MPVRLAVSPTLVDLHRLRERRRRAQRRRRRTQRVYRRAAFRTGPRYRMTGGRHGGRGRR